MSNKTERELLADFEKAADESNVAFQNSPDGMNYEEYMEYMEPFTNKIEQTSRLYRMVKTPIFTELDNNGSVMTLNDFIINVKHGGFIDYDGFGRYVKDGQESDIDIYPSDVDGGYLRVDFDTIVWYNR